MSHDLNTGKHTKRPIILLTETDATLQHRSHGGDDGLDAIQDDFSTNANPLGPPPFLLDALKQTARHHYPDPDYQALRHHLAQWHQVDFERILIAGSAGEWIWRFTHWLRDKNRLKRVWVPSPGYGEYAEASRRQGLITAEYPAYSALSSALAANELLWCCEPCNPTGAATSAETLQAIITQAQKTNTHVVMDLAYAPLQLDGSLWPATLDTPNVWRLFTPNKACALTGIRGAYVIAPPDDDLSVRSLAGFAPSWVMGVDGCVMLNAFASQLMHDYLADNRETLRDWRAQLVSGMQQLGWTVKPTHTHFMLAKPNVTAPELTHKLAQLRKNGIKLRDATSFGLPGWLRLRAMAPSAQARLFERWSTSE